MSSLDSAIDARGQGAIGVGDIDLGEQRARVRLERIGDACHLSGELSPGNFGNPNLCADAGFEPEGLVLRHMHKRADHVAPHDGEHEGADRRIGLHQAAHVDIALGDGAVERGNHALVVLLLLENLELGLLGREILLCDTHSRLLRLKRLLIDATLLLGDPAFLDQWLVAAPGYVGELGISLRLLQGGLRLSD
jgi:hypothetical protein